LILINLAGWLSEQDTASDPLRSTHVLKAGVPRSGRALVPRAGHPFV